MTLKTAATGLAIGLLLVACDRNLTAPGEAGAGKPDDLTQLAASAGSWTAKAPMSTARISLKAATVNGVIYAIGGTVYTNEGGLQVRRVEAYDVASNTWTVKKALPETINPNGATAINGKIYVAGGYSNERLSRALYVYDPRTNGWTRKADLPFTVSYSAAHQGAIDGKLYVYAGVTINADGSVGPHQFFRYNPASDKWVTLSRPSYARRGGASGVINGKLYLVGGSLPTSRNGVGKAYDVHIYDPATGWTKKPLGIYGLDSWSLAYAPLGGKLYIVGTNYQSDCTYDVSAVYDPATNVLSDFSSPAPLRTSAAGVAARGQFFLLGGWNYQPDAAGCGGETATTAEVWAYTP